jgi:hypothetical protein
MENNRAHIEATARPCGDIRSAISMADAINASKERCARLGVALAEIDPFRFSDAFNGILKQGARLR